MENQTLEGILDQKIWKTSAIIAGVDKGAMASRKRSIDEAIAEINKKFIVVEREKIDMLLSMITDHAVIKMNQELFGRQSKVPEPAEESPQTPGFTGPLQPSDTPPEGSGPAIMGPGTETGSTPGGTFPGAN